MLARSWLWSWETRDAKKRAADLMKILKDKRAKLVQPDNKNSISTEKIWKYGVSVGEKEPTNKSIKLSRALWLV